ncbi:DNA repair helicase (rad3) [Allomyces macrogynus ATCC 38327]|uniref:DNA 5'-3' helicase n=1 Tax=Allomyces macrogynus (strain ATCC 38327) TaxID=578462 RepID=A0A0L0S476_ALLM3|nr:DNA repair helicase (rad3) [Allomyces macrogynus ATCC 38327]|eukprot:KNE57240.1 DNA repair helicase (rad3) [Allomyces macrogynus ATCC 38327]
MGANHGGSLPASNAQHATTPAATAQRSSVSSHGATPAATRPAPPGMPGTAAAASPPIPTARRVPWAVQPADSSNDAPTILRPRYSQLPARPFAPPVTVSAPTPGSSSAPPPGPPITGTNVGVFRSLKRGPDTSGAGRGKVTKFPRGAGSARGRGRGGKGENGGGSGGRYQARIDFDRANDHGSPAPDEDTMPDLASGKTYTMSGVKVQFPFDAYPSQIQMMSKIIKALKDKSNALLESPTGSGKSLALLCASIAWREHEKQAIRDDYKEAHAKYQTDLLAWVEAKKEAKKTAASLASGSSSKTAASRLAVQLDDDDDDDFVRPRTPLHVQLAALTATPPSSDSSAATAVGEDDDKPKPPVMRKLPRIYFGSRTHKQLAQIIAEMRRNTVYRPKMAVIGSRNHYCLNKQVMKEPSRDEACMAAVENRNCPYYEGARALTMSRRLPSTWDIEDLKRVGERQRGCPYFASRLMAVEAEIVFAPYNYLMDPLIRQAMAIDLTDNIVILDEAHNIEDVARDASSLEIDDTQMDTMIKELRHLNDDMAGMDPNAVAEYKNPLPDFNVFLQLVQAIGEFKQENSVTFRTTTFDLKRNILPGGSLVRFLNSRGINDDFLQKLQQELAGAHRSKSEARENKLIPAPSQPTLHVLDSLYLVISSLMNPLYTDDYHIAVVQRVKKLSMARMEKKGDTWRSKVMLWCMNPGVTFSHVSVARSVILTSGTLSPMNSFASELQAPFDVRLEADHVIGADQTWVGVVPAAYLGPSSVEFLGTYAHSERLEYQDAVGHALAHLARAVPHGMLVFVPSYAFLEKIVERWRNTGVMRAIEGAKTVVFEPRVNKNNAFEDAIDEYYTAVEESVRQAQEVGALMFGVYRGKVSEGIDFSDDRARAVVCLGIPYPSTKDPQVELKRQFNDKRRISHGLLSGSEWYDVQAFRAINQALGRCIRHRNDWGALILLEKRLATSRHQAGLSKWVRPRIAVHQNLDAAVANLQGFLAHHGVRREPPKAGPDGAGGEDEDAMEEDDEAMTEMAAAEFAYAAASRGPSAPPLASPARAPLASPARMPFAGPARVPIVSPARPSLTGPARPLLVSPARPPPLAFVSNTPGPVQVSPAVSVGAAAAERPLDAAELAALLADDGGDDDWM